VCLVLSIGILEAPCAIAEARGHQFNSDEACDCIFDHTLDKRPGSDHPMTVTATTVSATMSSVTMPSRPTANLTRYYRQRPWLVARLRPSSRQRSEAGIIGQPITSGGGTAVL
jgi:hypothetical protein